MHSTDQPNATQWTDPDDTPELYQDWLEETHQYHGDILVKRGRGCRADRPMGSRVGKAPGAPSLEETTKLNPVAS